MQKGALRCFSVFVVSMGLADNVVGTMLFADYFVYFKGIMCFFNLLKYMAVESEQLVAVDDGQPVEPRLADKSVFEVELLG